MFRIYREVLTLPGAAGFASAGVLARLPTSMLGIGIVLLIKSDTGSYAAAGSLAGVFGLTRAFGSPLVGRAVDRFGQSRVMLPVIAVHLVGLALLLLSAELGARRWISLFAVVIAGVSTGSMGSLARARWSYLLTGQDRGPALLHAAYSLESVFDEVVFITGPILVTGLATRVAPAAGVIAAALAVGIGGTLLLLQRRTEPKPSGLAPRSGTGILRAPGMLVLLLVMICAGLIFGSVDVLTLAFADAQHELGAAGWVLACLALGSLLAGLAYGARQWQPAPGRRFLIAVLFLAIGVVPVLFVTNLAELAIVLFVAGFAVSPMLVSGAGLVQQLIVESRLTEGLTWMSSAVGLGLSAGAAIAGAAVEAIGPRQGLVVPVVAGGSAALIALLGARWLRPAI